MIVVSDTAPLNYLVLCQAVEVLPKLYAQVYAPGSVISELQHARTPAPVKAWLATSPPWLVVQDPVAKGVDFKLDRGETDAILLAEELKADLVLIDERPAVKVAQARGLKTLGTIGILLEAAKAGLLEFHAKIATLENETTFRMSRRLKEIINNLQLPPKHEEASNKKIPEEPQ